MLLAAISRMPSRRTSAVGHVCARRDWANFAKGIVGTKRQPQPTTYEEEGSR